MQRVRHPVGQEATHVNTGMSAEAGFFAPGLVMDTFAPPGTVEAGHRRPGDYDPVREREYALAYQNQLLGR